MTGERYLADTNTFIALLNKDAALIPFLESEWLYSFVTEIELLGKPGIKNEEVKEIKSLLSICVKLSHSDAISQSTILLRQKYKIKVPDALIAATSLNYNLPLLTFDKGFAKIESIDLILLDNRQQ